MATARQFSGPRSLACGGGRGDGEADEKRRIGWMAPRVAAGLPAADSPKTASRLDAITTPTMPSAQELHAATREVTASVHRGSEFINAQTRSAHTVRSRYTCLVRLASKLANSSSKPNIHTCTVNDCSPAWGEPSACNAKRSACDVGVQP